MIRFLFALSALVLLHSVPSLAQEILLEETVKNDTTPDKYGPNMRHFFHSWIGFGLLLGENKMGSEIEMGKSTSFSFGFRYKRKLGNFYAIGADLNYTLSSYRIKQDSAKILPNITLHNKEHLNLYTFDLNLYNRLNFQKRGNQIGKYLDLGAYGNVAFIKTHITYDKGLVPDAGRTMVTNSNLKYTNLLNYGVSARLGINKLALYANYRLSDLFKATALNAKFPELPRITTGIQLSLH